MELKTEQFASYVATLISMSLSLILRRTLRNWTKFQIDQKLNSLCEKIRNTHVTENYSEESSGEGFSVSCAASPRPRAQASRAKPSPHALGRHMKQRWTTLERKHRFFGNQWARAQLGGLWSHHAPARRQGLGTSSAAATVTSLCTGL